MRRVITFFELLGREEMLVDTACGSYTKEEAKEVLEKAGYALCPRPSGVSIDTWRKPRRRNPHGPDDRPMKAVVLLLIES